MAMQLQIEGYLKFQSPPTPETFHEVQYRLCPGWKQFKKSLFISPARVVLSGVGILMVWDLIPYRSLAEVWAEALKALGWYLHSE